MAGLFAFACLILAIWVYISHNKYSMIKKSIQEDSNLRVANERKISRLESENLRYKSEIELLKINNNDNYLSLKKEEESNLDEITKLKELLKIYNKDLSFYRNKSDNIEDEHDRKIKTIERLRDRLIKDTYKFLKSKLTPNNYTTTKKKLDSLFTFFTKNQVIIDKYEKDILFSELKEDFETIVRKDLEKQEQSRIKARIREEQKLEQERQQEIKRLELQEKAIEKALAKAIKQAKGEHDAEVERLEQELAEAKAKSERAVSQAQLTKAGYVYVISNIGSFGENVYKIGMTRRLEPMNRIKELSSASVPFSFDVHLMISSENAPSLENELHKKLNQYRVNKVNFRKEFFKVDIKNIIELVKESHGNVEYQIDPIALEYRESTEMDIDDYKFIESTLN